MGFKLKCFSILGLLVMATGLLALWGLQRADTRRPASFGEKRVIPELDVYERQEAFQLRFSEEYNICDDHLEVMFVLEALNVAVLSETEPQIQIQISTSCERPFDSPIFFNSFCSEGLMHETYDGVLYKMINGMGFFPREWKMKKILIGSQEVSMENQSVLQNFIFSCY